MPELTLKDGRCLLAAQRRTAIVEQVRARGGARLSDLALSSASLTLPFAATLTHWPATAWSAKSTAERWP